MSAKRLLLKRIDELLADPEITAIFYAMFFDRINREFDQGNQVTLVSFPSLEVLKKWCETGRIDKSPEFMFVRVESILSHTAEKHKDVMKLCQEDKTNLCIFITAKGNCGSHEYQISCLVLKKMTDPQDLQFLTMNYPKYFTHKFNLQNEVPPK